MLMDAPVDSLLGRDSDAGSENAEAPAAGGAVSSATGLSADNSASISFCDRVSTIHGLRSCEKKDSSVNEEGWNNNLNNSTFRCRFAQNVVKFSLDVFVKETVDKIFFCPLNVQLHKDIDDFVA